MNIQTPPNKEEIEAVLGLDSGSRRRKRLSWLVWLVILAVMIAGGAWWYASASRQTAAISYQTEPARRQDLVVRVQATGRIQPTTQVDVSSEMSGVIRSVNVQNNSIVKKGDVLAELDAVRLNAQLARAKASLAAAEARLLDARATLAERQLAYDRADALRRKGISAAQDLEQARAALSRAEAGVAASEADIAVAEAEVKMQETDISRTRIVSPVDGVVIGLTNNPLVNQGDSLVHLAEL